MREEEGTLLLGLDVNILKEARREFKPCPLQPERLPLWLVIEAD